MFKTLSILHTVNLPVITIFLFLAVFFGAFVFWRKLRNEGEYTEVEIFDDFLIALLLGWSAGRLVFVLLNLGNFGLQILQWLNFIVYPGINLLVAIMVTGGFLYWRVKKRKLDALEILDFWAIATSLGMFFYDVGQFFDGSGVGEPTKLPWGVVFPGMILPTHPAMLYTALFFLVMFLYLSWAEFHYRTFDWYRHGRNNAQAGFCAGFFIMMTGIYLLISLLWRSANFLVAGISLDIPFYLLVAIFGGGMIWICSGRSLIGRKR